MNIQKSVTILYVNNELPEREIKKTIPFIIASKRIKPRNKSSQGSKRHVLGKL